ncbi:hypothetical protein ACFPOU_19855 [Massilia jejuensis]|uniref:Uncharacterized protein n=1 Tax=Massilia jejuensis TaxID=648894 RepID=A0ABW0PLJ2_9BURK
MIRKGQFAIDGADAMSLTDQFSALVCNFSPVTPALPMKVTGIC